MKDKKLTVCDYCKKEYSGFGHNGEPLVNGRVCDECNIKVIEKRLNNVMKEVGMKIYMAGNEK